MRASVALGTVLVVLSLPAAASETLSPKIAARISNGIYLNAGTSGGSSVAIGGFNLAYSHFLAPNFALGGGYQLDFDYASGLLLLHGFDGFARYYWRGEGTFRKTDSAEISSTYLGGHSYYAGVGFSQRDYYLGSNSTDQPGGDLTGSFLSANVVIGTDITLSRHFGLNFEGSFGALAFAASDDRYRVQAMVLYSGLFFVW